MASITRHGVAGFPSAEAYKLGSSTPYARLQRAFLRQTINLGGDTENVDDDFTQFKGTRSTDRLVLTVGRFGVNDIFDTNRYANNPKSDFLNWSLVNAGTFDYAGDGWGYTYGAAGEWYTGPWTLRAGVFDLSATPAGGVSPLGGTNDPTFQQFSGARRNRAALRPVGPAGQDQDHRLLEPTAAPAISTTRSRSRKPRECRPTSTRCAPIPAVLASASISSSRSTETLGVFLRAGWADGQIEPWDFTDIDRTVSGGVSIDGKSWGRPDDTIGIAGVVNGISSAHVAFLNAGGLGILIGDGQLTNYGLEKIFEAYYSYALTSSTKLTFDYQFIGNPGYNADRGPANVFAVRAHWQF